MFLIRIEKEFADENQVEFRARRLVEKLGIALQAAFLIQFGNQAITNAFCASCLTGDQAGVLGTLFTGMDTTTIIDRSLPQ